MSTGLIAITVYFVIALAIMIAFCRAAARGDRAMDGRSLNDFEQPA
jgi:hypothetical protein